ncbi:MAG: hypothetical protein ACHQM6_06205, partial [Candidatus Kapaibacterium sp.]
MKKNNCSILISAVLLFSFTLINSGFAQKKNILRIHFETARVKQGTSTVFLNVYYKIEGTKPYNFTGFECQYNYDQTKIRPTNTFFDGTASGIAGSNAHSNDANNTHYVLVDNFPASLDTSKPVLFQVFYSVRTDFKDSAMIAPIVFDVGGSTGIDTVIIDNASGRDDISWFPFGLVFIDTTKPPPPPKKKDIILSSDSTDIQSDSVKTVSLKVSLLDSTNIKSSLFEFDYDTAAFSTVTVSKGTLLANGSIAVSQDTNHIAVKFSNTDTSKALTTAGELLRIQLKGNKRTDTLCTVLMNPKLAVLNSDNLVSTITYKFQGICILGRQKDTVTKGVVSAGENPDSPIMINPNPARTYVDFLLPGWQGEKKHLVVFD